MPFEALNRLQSRN